MISSTFLEDSPVDLEMSFSFFERPFIFPGRLLSDFSLAHLLSPGGPTLSPPPHTLQAELGAPLSLVPNIHCVQGSVAVPVLGTGALGQQDLAADSWSPSGDRLMKTQL